MTKVKIRREDRKIFSMEDGDYLKALALRLNADPMNQDDAVDFEDMIDMASHILGNDAEVFDSTIDVYFARNGRAWNAFPTLNYMESKDFDVWMEFTCKYWDMERSKQVIAEVGIYLTDVWQLSAENKQEIMEHMYIGRYIAE